MNKEYTISKVSSEVKTWEGQYGVMKTYRVRLEDHSDVVELNKKPDSPAPKEGDTLYGSIQVSEYGHKFKAAQKPQGQRSFGRTKDEQWAIMRQTALKAAVDHVGASIDNKPDTKSVLTVAAEFYSWLVVTEDKEKSEMVETVKEVFGEDVRTEEDF